MKGEYLPVVLFILSCDSYARSRLYTSHVNPVRGDVICRDIKQQPSSPSSNPGNTQILTWLMTNNIQDTINMSANNLC